MKKIALSTCLAIFSLSFVLLSCGGENNQNVKINTAEEVKAAKSKIPDIADASFVDGMTGKVFHNYLQVKMALVNSDTDAVQTAAGNLAEAFSSQREDLKALAKKMADSNKLEEQRTLFSAFTNQVESLFKDNIAEGKIYKKYCPMAFDNTGANWFSDITEINNPYFGDKMLRCGSIKETIKK